VLPRGRPDSPSAQADPIFPAMSSLSSRTRSAPGGFIEPCLPSPADKPPSASSWIHEIKHDGYRSWPGANPLAFGC
jgi:ATP-dependent DNA ligase